MQDIANKILNKFKKEFWKYLSYLLILVLAYLAGDQKLVQDMFNKLSINFEIQNHSQSENQANLREHLSSRESSKQNEGESQDRIYFVGKYKVTHVVDGDTFDFINENGKKDTVRIMAVNTLEMKETDPTKLCFAKKQTQFTKEYLNGKEVFLYADKTQGLRDKYQRILAYVATSSQDISVSSKYQNNYFYNDYLVETGNADTYRANPPAILFSRFESERRIAETKKLGMWGSTCQN